MRRPALYSRSPSVPQQQAWAGKVDEPQAQAGAADDSVAPDAQATTQVAAPPAAPRRHVWRNTLLGVLLLGALGVGGYEFLPRHASHQLTQKDIDAAVMRSLQTATLPSAAARAADIIRPSVVEITALGTEKNTPAAKVEKRGRNLARGKPPQADPPPGPSGEVERGVGTGVVIVDKGVILTNLHVIAGADKIKVTFFDGLEANASVIGMQPENDLAVLQADKIPDDLVPATMRSTADLMPGDNVAVVGFPFGIGPSVSAGVVSGLKRSFRSPEGKQEMNNLIQFDAAANPGNSGGPMVNMDGEVLGIVTAILNPTQQRTFIGIGFAVPIENAASAAGMPPF
ncbi:MAG: trypsin-like peptidase domain-containing protein [Proteobacteria bacterium]|nr:trypsin-like peptidase domain-containing protein [Pseudomonadota bacterium]